MKLYRRSSQVIDFDFINTKINIAIGLNTN